MFFGKNSITKLLKCDVFKDYTTLQKLYITKIHRLQRNSRIQPVSETNKK
ncbi:MAG: hypothetical protein K0R05_1091 [Anaerocolumna sp.]|jgi:hypothetical protein|nr:hypothetical protein [Anaerocolumna sp.]